MVIIQDNGGTGLINFTLKCDQGHIFESWFQSAEAFDKLRQRNMISCAVCGSQKVEKTIMAPRVVTSREKSSAKPSEKPTPLSSPASTAEQALVALKKRIEERSEYVGKNFVREARDIHGGLVPERLIHGEARPEEARKLLEDGVPVAPLPFATGRKSN